MQDSKASTTAVVAREGPGTLCKVLESVGWERMEEVREGAGETAWVSTGRLVMGEPEWV